MAQSSRETEPRIQEAIDTYKRDENQKISKIAQEFQVPYQRLSRRLNGIPSKLNSQPTTPLLNKHQEEALKNWIFQQDETCLVPTAKQIRDRANAILAQSHTAHNQPPPHVGNMWAYRFIAKLPPEFRCRKQNSTNSKDMSRWPELEQALYEWILQEREQKNKVPGDIICRKAEQMWPVVYPEKGGTMPTFTSRWLRGFTSRRLRGLGAEVGDDDTATAIEMVLDQTLLVSPEGDSQVSSGGHEESERIGSNQDTSPQMSARPGATPHQDDISLISSAEALEALYTVRLHEEQQPVGNPRVIQALNRHERVIEQRMQQQRRSGI